MSGIVRSKHVKENPSPGFDSPAPFFGANKVFYYINYCVHSFIVLNHYEDLAPIPYNKNLLLLSLNSVQLANVSEIIGNNPKNLLQGVSGY
jgi:hypothetical protein